jgi:hypothetical protein
MCIKLEVLLTDMGTLKLAKKEILFFEISHCHSGKYEDDSLLGYSAMLSDLSR